MLKSISPENRLINLNKEKRYLSIRSFNQYLKRLFISLPKFCGLPVFSVILEKNDHESHIVEDEKLVAKESDYILSIEQQF